MILFFSKAIYSTPLACESQRSFCPEMLKNGVIAAKSRRYIIWDYIKDEILVLGTFDRQNLLFLRKINSASIRKVTNTINIDNAKYNLQGVKVEDPEGIYIQNGQKFIAK